MYCLHLIELKLCHACNDDVAIAILCKFADFQLFILVHDISNILVKHNFSWPSR